MILTEKVMQAELRWCLVVFALCLGQEAAAAGAVCERGRTWWDRQRAACTPCTACDAALHQAVRLPCELHRDTVCQSLYDLQIFTEPSDSDDYYDYEESEVESEWNYQALTLALAASGCVVFFVVVLFLSFYHAKQWRILKQALKSDVKDLSAKLRLMEAAEEPPGAPPRHIYCNIHVAKDAFIGPGGGKKGLANVYTQEKLSS